MASDTYLTVFAVGMASGMLVSGWISYRINQFRNRRFQRRIGRRAWMI